MENQFLPICQADMQKRGWNQLDFLFISGDAYVDHPSFGPAIITRLLEKKGYRVGIISQPNWQNTKDFKSMGKPRLAVLISAGNLDSLLNKFTAAKRFRSTDAYSPGGQANCRPDRATLVYSSRVRELWKDTPIIIGGIEASLRRFAHYDYWSDSVRRSILIDSQANMLIYGMGEKAIVEIASYLSQGNPLQQLHNLPGTCYLTENPAEIPSEAVTLPSYDKVRSSKHDFSDAFRLIYQEQDPIRGKIICQNHGKQYLVQNPPSKPLTTEEMDEIYDLPFQRTYHPSYEKAGGIPAIQEVKFSIVSHRGCFGGCSFCAIQSHQGRFIQNRSHASILREANLLTSLPDFKGYIHDVGGPTANFRVPACKKQWEVGACKDRQCLYPSPCKNLEASHADYLELLTAIRKVPGIKKVFIRSGIRYDYLLAASDAQEFLKNLCQHHVSGQLKIAPEHISSPVLSCMNKSGKQVYMNFVQAYTQENKIQNKEQYLVPYFMSSHPGASLKEAIELAEFTRDLRYHPEQVQDFIPTPGTLSTCIYYTGIHPLTGEKIFTAKNSHEKKLQRALLQFRNPKNYELVLEALQKENRYDLIGWDEKCLIRPPKHPQKTPDSEKKEKASRQAKKKRSLPPGRNTGESATGKKQKSRSYFSK